LSASRFVGDGSWSDRFFSFYGIFFLCLRVREGPNNPDVILFIFFAEVHARSVFIPGGCKENEPISAASALLGCVSMEKINNPKIFLCPVTDFQKPSIQ
jgi:hypothetical protein